MNALLGEERVIVSAVAGTTRDATDTNFVGPDGQVRGRGDVLLFDGWVTHHGLEARTEGQRDGWMTTWLIVD